MAGGRPRGSKNKMSTEFIKPIAQRYGPEIIEKLHRIAMHSKNEQSVIKAGELVLAYGYGKPQQALEVTGANGQPLQTTPPCVNVHFIRPIEPQHIPENGDSDSATVN
jgi:hypothetical protein